MDSPQLKTTEEVVKEMLLENTGSHFLDSGQTYGYQYERRKERKFEEEPEGTYEVSIDDNKDELIITPTLNVYHALVNNFKYDETFTEMLRAYGEMTGYGTWGEELTEGFAEKIGAYHINTYNTYNFDNFLETCLLITDFKIEKHSEDYSIISTHNGCDVRGGYSDARVFYSGDMTDNRLYYQMTQASLVCPECDKDEASDLTTDSGWSIRVPILSRLKTKDTEIINDRYEIGKDGNLYCKCGNKMELYFG